MMGALVLIGVIVFASVFTGMMALAAPQRQRIRQRLGIDELALTSERRLEGSFLHRNIAPFAAKMGGRFAAVLPHNAIRGVERQLLAANEPWSLHGFLAVWILFAGLGVAFPTYVAFVGSTTPLQLVVLGSLSITLASLMPYMVLRRRIRARQKAIVQGLPDALDLLVTCVEAGMGVDAAFVMVAEKSEGPLAETFTLYLRQVGLGRARRDALLYVAERTGVRDLIVMASAVAQGEELGTTLSDVLRAQAEDLRVRRRQRAEAAAQRAPVLMTIPLVLCFMPAMAMVVVVPSILNLLDFVKG
jgi:tight adherence protein C